MEGFNLLPEEYQTRRGARFVPISVLATLGIVLLGVVLMEHAVMVQANRGAGSSLVETLTARRAELAEARQEREALESEIGPLAAMLSRTPVWSNLFIDVAGLMGPNARFMQWSADADQGTCSIEGRARTNGEVFVLVAALEALPHFETVALVGVAKENDGKNDGVHYEIVCRLRQTGR